MFTLSVVVCLASGLDFECNRQSRIFKTLDECMDVGGAMVAYIKQSSPVYVGGYCVKGGLT